MRDREIGITAFIGGSVAVVALSIAWSALWFGLALSTLWGWFVVPLLDVAHIGIGQAYGLILVAKALLAEIPKEYGNEGSLGGRMVRAFLISPLLAALSMSIGWVVSLWT